MTLLAESAEGNDYDGVVQGITLPVSVAYTIEIQAADKVGMNGTAEVRIPTAEMTLHLGDGGKAAAVGRYANESGERRLDVAWDSYFEGNVQVEGEIKIGGKRICDLIYPVGSIYLSANAASPQTLFGGEWKRLEGRFLIGAGSEYAAGSTGGEARHTLTVDEIPNHEHWVRQRGNTSRAYTQDCYAPGGSEDPYSSIIRADMSGDYAKPSVSWGGQLVAGEVISDDHNQPHNNLPPYLAVYMWKRTA